jgi:hypothetical protein
MLVDDDKAIGIMEREAPQQRAFDQAEDRRVGAEPKRKNQDDDD